MKTKEMMKSEEIKHFLSTKKNKKKKHFLSTPHLHFPHGMVANKRYFKSHCSSEGVNIIKLNAGVPIL